MDRRPAQTANNARAIAFGIDGKKMGVGGTTVTVNTVATVCVRALWRIVRITEIRMEALLHLCAHRDAVSRSTLVPVRREHEVRERDEHQKEDQGDAFHEPEFTASQSRNTSLPVFCGFRRQKS